MELRLSTIDRSMMGEKRADLTAMAPSLEASGESTGGGEIRVSEGMFEGELDLGVQIRIRVPPTDTRSLLRR